MGITPQNESEKPSPRHRINPVELGVLALVAVMCAFSLFQLVKNPPEFTAAERGLASQVVRENAVAQARSRSFLSLELN
jgi:Zn-dependent membrane protease YugP